MHAQASVADLINWKKVYPWLKIKWMKWSEKRSVEKTLNDLMELKTMAWELRDARTSFSSRFDQVEERIWETEDQFTEIRHEDKIREKRMKRNEQSLQEIWDYVKRPNLHLIGVHESDAGMS